MLINKLGGLGWMYFLFIYFGGILAASMPALLKHRDNYNYNSVGASGAVSAILFATITLVPFQGGIGILFIPFTIPPFIFGILYIAYEVYMDKRSQDNVAHDAHIWGAVFGFVFTLLFVPEAFLGFLAQLVSVF